MKLLINKIKAEFNKIYGGNKRVGDSLHLEGKRESQLEVSNAMTLGYKSESTLNVKHSVYSDNAEKLRSVGLDGEPDVNPDGDPVFKTENQLNVNNSQYLRNVAPTNLEVDIARRLKVGDQADSPIISVSSLVTHPNIYRVRDSGLLGGKLENDLSVRRSRDADNADLLNDTAQADLVVEKARIATKLTTNDGLELKEEELRVKKADTISYGSDAALNIYGIKDYILEHDDAKNIIPRLATTATHIAVSGQGLGFTFPDIMEHLKTDTNSEIFKAKRIITGDGAKDGDVYKTWIIDHNDFKNKVAVLNAGSADRATKIGDTSTSYTAGELITHIQENVTIAAATNATKLQNNTPDDLFNTIRSRILTNAGANLVQSEVDGFFGAAKVKIAVQGIKVSNAVNADTIETKTLAQIYQQVKDNGQVLSAKYIYSDPNGGGQKSYIDITNDINNSQLTLLGGASTGYNSLGKLENIIINNKTTIENALSIETTNRRAADNTLQTNINTETTKRASGDTALNTRINIFKNILGGTINESLQTLNYTGTNFVDNKGTLEAAIKELDSQTYSAQNQALSFSQSLQTEIDTINAKTVKFSTSDFDITDNGYGTPRSIYRIFGKILTNDNSVVYSNGLKLRKKHNLVYTLTNNGTDTTFSIIDITKFAIGDLVEIETIVYN